jgi:lysophospholipase L1-like esterase
MTMFRTTTRRPVVIALIVTLLIAPFIAWQAATGGERLPVSSLAPHGIVVVGDSITARYNDQPGDPMQGWWSMVGHRFGADVKTYAQSGSGYLRPGDHCKGNRFIDRIGAYDGPAPSIFIIEGGRNDWSICQDDRYVVAPDDVIASAVNRYLDALQTALPASTRIIVLGPPWGPLDPTNGIRVTAIIEAAAERHGLQFISTHGALTARGVVDGIHPNRRGSIAIADRVIDALDG